MSGCGGVGGGGDLVQQTKHRQGMLGCHIGIWGEYGRNAAGLVQAFLRVTYMFLKHICIDAT